MEIRKETKWLCENSHALERYSGKWVMFDTNGGTVRESGSLAHLLRGPRPAGPEKSFVLHVPSKRELLEPRPVVRRR